MALALHQPGSQPTLPLPEAKSSCPSSPASSSPGASPFRAAVAEWLAEDLQQLGITDEHLATWQKQEHAVLALQARRAPAAQGPEPVARQRWLALNLAQMATQLGPAEVFGAAEERWYHMAQLLDLACLGPGAPPERVLACTAAAWLVSAKFHGRGGPEAVTSLHVEQLAACASSLGEVSSGGGGYAVVQPADIVREEVSLALSLQYNVASPTVHIWVGAFAARFGLATKGRLPAVLSAAGRLQGDLAQLLVWHSRVSPERPPRPSAVGVFALTIAAVYPTVSDQLCPPEIDPAVWSLTLSAVLTNSLAELHGGQLTLPQSLAKRSAAGASCQLEKAVGAALEFATACDMDAIREITWKLLELLRAAMAPHLPSVTPPPVPEFPRR